MAAFTTRAIVLRRVAFGDFDLIVTLLTLNRGKITVMAKAAKKSVKRFAGALELFTPIQAVCNKGRGMPILQEASLENPLANIRLDVGKTAYASYWAEIIDIYLEENHKQPELYRLLYFTLTSLDAGRRSGEMWSILFMMRFLILAGLEPRFDRCFVCKTDVERSPAFFFDLTKGGIICERCNSSPSGKIRLMKGTIKQLQWLGKKELSQAARARFSAGAVDEALSVLEAFLPYHLGKTPRSLKFLKGLRFNPDGC